MQKQKVTNKKKQIAEENKDNWMADNLEPGVKDKSARVLQVLVVYFCRTLILISPCSFCHPEVYE